MPEGSILVKLDSAGSYDTATDAVG